MLHNKDGQDKSSVIKASVSAMPAYGSLDEFSDTSMSSSTERKRKWRLGLSTPTRLTDPTRGSETSVGVANKAKGGSPGTVNTFGSVRPDVTSEVDLNTTSETDPEDKGRNYEPNILERALERTICYHRRRSFRSSTMIVILLCLLTLVSQAGVVVMSPIYTTAMRNAGGDEMVAQLSLVAVMPVPVALLALVLKHAYDKTITLRPTTSVLLYAGLGVCLALRLNMGVYASHPHRTPPSLQPGMASGVTIILAILLTLCIIRKGFSLRRLACCTIAVGGIFVCVEPYIWSLEGSDVNDLFIHSSLVKQIVWPSIFTASFLPLAVYTALAQREIKTNMTHPISISSSGLLAGCAVSLGLVGTDFLPFYGNVSNFSEMWEVFKTGFPCNFSYAPHCHNCLIKLILLSTAIMSYNIFSILLLSTTEGCVFSSLVASLSVPLAGAFWCVFQYDYVNGGEISWNPQWSHTAAFILGGTALMLPAVIAYNIFSVLDAKKVKREQTGYSDVSSSEYEWE